MAGSLSSAITGECFLAFSFIFLGSLLLFLKKAFDFSMRIHEEGGTGTVLSWATHVCSLEYDNFLFVLSHN